MMKARKEIRMRERVRQGKGRMEVGAKRTD